MAGLAEALEQTQLRDPAFPVYANVTPSPSTSAADAASFSLEQLTAPVRWTQVVERLAADYPDALYVEMGPGNVLTGLVKKIAPVGRRLRPAAPPPKSNNCSRRVA